MKGPAGPEGAPQSVLVTVDSADLGNALGCSAATLEDMQGLGVISARGELWDVERARDYLRDAAWAGNLWQ